MNCLLCKDSTIESKSVEHVIPESLGNIFYVLDKGVVCDSCNNYFARKIEGPLLEMPFFLQIRHKLDIESKKGRIPSKKGFLIQPELAEVIFTKHKRKGHGLELPDDTVRRKIKNRKRVPVFFTEYGLFDIRNPVLSKFLAKVGIEGLAFDVIRYKGNMEEVVNQKALDLVKRYCRFPKTNEFWPYRIRQVQTPAGESQNPLNRLIFHYTFIYTKSGHFFHQLYVHGVELTIDMVNPSLEHIDNWFLDNPGKSEVLDKALSLIIDNEKN